MMKSYSASVFAIAFAFLAIETAPGIAKEFSCPDEITMKTEKSGLSFEGDPLTLRSAVYKSKEREFKCIYHPMGLERIFNLHAKLLPADAKGCKFENGEEPKEKECTKPPCVLKCED